MADDAAAPDGELSDSAATEETSSATEPESAASETPEAAAVTDGVTDGDEDNADYDEEATDQEAAAPAKPRMSHLRLAMIAGVVAVLALAGLTGWLGFRTYQSHQADEQQKLFLQVGRQGALNLTSIDFQHADADVQRILDSATGTFYDDFDKRSKPFIEVVKQAQSKSVGTIAEAGLESESDNGAQVLVAVTVKTSNAGAPEQAPRAWRMRISVQKVGDEAKVSNVEFVP
ncbi:MAG: Mce protein [Mycobacterium sp.]|jgi:Mce-associated membrane protein|uniref:Mce protein n=1 Tax=Mycobacterium sp. TaxID=1785 RepID=UPI003899F275